MDLEGNPASSYATGILQKFLCLKETQALDRPYNVPDSLVYAAFLDDEQMALRHMHEAK